jgi:hypothetical protein
MNAEDPTVAAVLADECGYQDVECWVRQLRAAGWLPVSVRTSKEVHGSTVWRSPHGLLYRGPYRAWRVMKDSAGERTNDDY